MDDTKLTDLRAYYESLTDEALLAEAEQGPDGFTVAAWAVIAEQVEQRGLKHDRESQRGRNGKHGAAVAESSDRRPTLVERLAARIDDLPPTVRPAAFGASIVLMFAMARGAWIVVPVAVIYVLATSPDPWAWLMTGVGISVLAIAGGALSGLAYGLVGRHVRSAFRGGCYLAGLVTLAPYMFLVPYILRLADGVPFWHRPRGGELAISGIMTLLFGLVLGRAWSEPVKTAEHPKRAT